jgi:hypothetical protein
VTRDPEGERKLDDLTHVEFLDAAMRSPVKRSARGEGCPDEPFYWTFLDDETSLPDSVLQHIPTCQYCTGELQRIVSSMTTQVDLSAGTEKGMLERINKKLSAPPRLSFKRIGDSILAVLNPLPLAEAYRSGRSEAIAVSERTRVGDFVVEFLTGSNAGQVEIIVHPGKVKKRKTQVEAELWQEGALVRSVPIEAGRRFSLSQWPKGQYRLILRLDKESLSSIDITFL